MNVAVHQVDGSMPNLALMKIAGYHLARGDNVTREFQGDTERAYISCVFTWNRNLIGKYLGYYKMIGCEDVRIGGSGVSLTKNLSGVVERTTPAYDLWGVDYSMGFTSRGCIRKCAFCIVPKKEGGIVAHQKIGEFHDKRHDNIILLDNSFLVSPNFQDTIDYLNGRGLKVNICQGLDTRLLSKSKAKEISKVKLYDWKFISRRVHLAFDDWRYRKSVEKAVSYLVDIGLRPRDMIVYVLAGYREEGIDRPDRERRVEYLRGLGVLPFIMKFNRRTDNKLLNAYTRYVNRPTLFFACSWDEYRERKGLM